MFDEGNVAGWRKVSGPEPCCPGSDHLPCAHERALVAELHAAEAEQLDAATDVATLAHQEPEKPSSSTDSGVLLAETEGVSGLRLGLALEQVALTELDVGELVDATAAWSRVIAWAEARRGQAAALLSEELYRLAGPLSGASMGSTPPGRDSHRVAATELSMRLGTTRAAAERVVRTGRLLNGPLQGTAEALEEGDIDQRKAEIIADALEGTPLPVALAVEDAVLPTAGRRTHPQLTKDLAKALIEVDAAEAVNRHRRARTRRRVDHPRALPDGMASISAVLPAEDAVAIDLALDAVARTARSGGDRRTIDQLRADALSAVGTEALRSGHLGSAPGCRCALRPTSSGSPGARVPGRAAPTRSHVGPPASTRPPVDLPAPTGSDSGPSAPAEPPSAVPVPRALGTIGGEPVRVQVTVPLSTLLGGGGAGEIDGYGPIDAATARALALGGVWRRIVTDPLSGTALDVGRSRYRPPPDLARLVRARDGTCVRPGCGARASSCDLDHTVPFGRGPDGGATALRNLGAQCRTDHLLKTNGDFRVRQLPGGVFEWTSRTGHTYRRESDGAITHLGRTEPRRPRTTATNAPHLTDPMAEPDDADLPPLRAWHSAGPGSAPDAPDSSNTTTPRSDTPWGQGDCPF